MDGHKAEVKYGERAGTFEFGVYGDSILFSIASPNMSMASMITDLPGLFNVWRALGDALEEAQPGLTCDPEPGSPDEVDAMQVVFEADQRRKEVK